MTLWKWVRRAAVDDGSKLVESARNRRRAITGAHLVALVRSGARSENGALVERDEAVAA